MKIIPYHPRYKEAFIEMNKAWIEAMFVLEDEDVAVLGSVEETIAQGGQIYFALDEAGEAMACCMIAPKRNGEWEIEKFAARGMYTGVGAGSACLSACIEHAKRSGAEKIVIVSNRKCVHAVRLYRKFGFREVPVDKEKFHFERADIAFERTLED